MSLPSTLPLVPRSVDPDRLRQLVDTLVTIGSDLDLPAVLERIVQGAVDLVDARYGALGVLDPSRTRLAQFITVGVSDEERARIGPPPEGHGILGLLILDAEPLRLSNLNQHPDSYGVSSNHPPMTSFLGAPIVVRGEVFGNLYLTDKTTADEFSATDQELVVALATAAGVAIDNARLHARLNDLALLEDRERIARDLHDTVIQRVFAVGLGLQNTARLVHTDPASVSQRIEAAVDDLDTTVKEIRTAIFDLELPQAGDSSLRMQVLAAARDQAEALGFEPRVLLDGPIDLGIDQALGHELLATLREALSNVARHASASRVHVEIYAGMDLVLRVTDDGIGPPGPEATGGGRGLRNMADRADRLGGSFNLVPGTSGGSVLTWTVPLH